MKTIVIFAFVAGIFAVDCLGVPESTPIPVIPAHAAFRLIFKAYDGEPQREEPSQFSFQVDTVDFRQPSEFLRLGEMIPHTHFRLKRFTYKTWWNLNIKDNEDVSELTIVNVETGATAVLIYNRLIDVSGGSDPAPRATK